MCDGLNQEKTTFKRQYDVVWLSFRRQFTPFLEKSTSRLPSEFDLILFIQWWQQWFHFFLRGDWV